MRIIIELDTNNQASVNVTPQTGASTIAKTPDVMNAQDIPVIDAGSAPGTSAELSGLTGKTTMTGEANQLITDAVSAGGAPDLTTG